MQRTNIEYTELSKAKVTPSRNLVISKCSGAKGGYILTQQLNVIEGDRVTPIFLKGSVHVVDVDGLYNIRDALNMAISAIVDNEKVSESECNWDSNEDI